MTNQLFSLGQVVGTPGALEALENAGEEPLGYLYRHMTGDFGTLGNYHETVLTDDELKLGPLATGDDDKLNKYGIDTGESRIMSAYLLKDGVKIWIITEWDRSVTTILLPSEY